MSVLSDIVRKTTKSPQITTPDAFSIRSGSLKRSIDSSTLSGSQKKIAELAHSFEQYPYSITKPKVLEKMRSIEASIQEDTASKVAASFERRPTLSRPKPQTAGVSTRVKSELPVRFRHGSPPNGRGEV